MLRTFARLCAFALAALINLCAVAPARAEVPIVEPGDYGLYESAQYVPEPWFMWFVMGQLQSGSDVDMAQFDYTAGERFKAVVFIPALDDVKEFSPKLALIGPGLPQAPAGSLPFPIPPGMGVITAQRDSTFNYFDPFTQMSYLPRAELELIMPETGRYYAAVYGEPVGRAKYALDIGIMETFAPHVMAMYPVYWWQVRGYLDYGHWPMVLYVPMWLVIGAIVASYGLARASERETPLAFGIAHCAGDPFVKVGDLDIHYTDEGPADGPVVVMLHGFGGWAFTWRHQREALAAAGYRVLTVDLLGYGASARPARAQYSTRDQAEVVLGAVRALGVERADWVGHSFGGRVAMQIAIIAPERVRALVALAPEAFARERPGVAAVLKIPALGHAVAYASTRRMWVAPFLRWSTGRRDAAAHAWITPAVVDGYAAPIRIKGTVRGQVWQGRSPKDGAEPVPDNLPRVTAPALLIWGEDDPVFPVDDGRRLARILPNAALRVLACGHMPHEERPADVNEAILSFLSTP